MRDGKQEHVEKATISWEADNEVDGNTGYEMNVLAVIAVSK